MSEKEPRFPHIRELREDADLSQTNMANILNCSQVAYSYYEIGKRNIQAQVFLFLFSILEQHCILLQTLIFVFHIYFLLV